MSRGQREDKEDKGVGTQEMKLSYLERHGLQKHLEKGKTVVVQRHKSPWKMNMKPKHAMFA